MNGLALYDIVTQSYIPWWRQPWFYIITILTLIGAVCIIWILYKFLQKKKLTAYERALRELESIHLKNITSQEDQKKYYAKLSAVLKKFMYEQFQFDSIGKTDHELLSYLADRKYPMDIIEKIEQLFNGLDEIKFATKTTAQQKIQDDYSSILVILARSRAYAKEVQENRGA